MFQIEFIPKTLLPLLYQIPFFLTTAIICWPSIIVTWTVFFCFKTILDLILRWRHGHRYGGLVNKEDMFFDRTDQVLSKYVITIVMIFKSERKMNVLDFIKETLQDKVFNRPYDDYIKLTSTRHICSGYSYYLKNNYSLDECVKTMPESNQPLSEEDLRQFTKTTFNLPLPKNDCAMWEVFVSESHLNRKENEKTDAFRYPVVMRFHHAVADGTSLVGFLLNTFSNSNVENFNEKIFHKQKVTEENFQQKVEHLLYESINFVLLSIYFIFIGPGILLINMYLRTNQIGRPKCNSQIPAGDSHVIWPTVTNLNYMSKIKQIKNRIPDTKFSQIIFTALSGSLSRYFQRNSLPVSKYVPAIVPRILDYPKQDKSKPAKLINKSAVYFVDLPMSATCSLTETLEKLKLNDNKMNHFKIVSGRFFLLKIFGIFPRQLATKLFNVRSPCIFITNIPGAAKIQISSSLSIETIIPFAPVTTNVEFCISTFSYGDQFLMNLHVEKEMIPLQSEAQRIINDCYVNFDLFDIETKRCNGK